MNAQEHKLPSSQPILIVEDSEDDFEATQRAFTKANFHNPIQHASSGEDAVAYLRSPTTAKPGLILLDLNMPGMDGRKTLQLIKANDHTRNIPVIVLTTSNDERDIHDCYAFGANTYIQKPVDLDALFAAVRRLKEYWFEIAILPKVTLHV